MSATDQIVLDFSRPWNYAECAYFLRIAESTLRDRVKRGKGPPRIKMSDAGQGQVLFWPLTVVDWLTGQQVPPPIQPRGSGRPVKRLGHSRKGGK